MSASVEVPRPGLWQRLGDGLNPLVVKEVRQGLRTRVFWISFGLMLLACLMLSLVAYASAQEAFSAQGRGYFFAFFTCLGLVHFLVIPYTAYRSLAREREDETWVLLTLTGLGPRRILRGKVASYLVQAALYASAVGPFLLFSYFLNGIALPTILLTLTLGGVWMLFLTVLAVCAAALADSRLGRGLIHFCVLGALGMAVFFALSMAYLLSDEGERLFRDNDVLYAMGAIIWFMVSYAWLFFETAASRLSLVTENYTRGPRLALTVQALVTALGVVLLWVAENLDDDVPVVACVLGCLHLSFCGLFAATDVDGQARALRPHTRVYSLLRPGALRGFRLVVLMVLGWMALCAGLHLVSRSGSSGESERMAMMSAPAYLLLYLSAALLVGRMPSGDKLASPAVVRVLFLCLAGLGGTLPPLAAILLGEKVDHPLINLLNPFIGIANFGRYDYSTSEPRMNQALLGFVWVVTLLAIFAADRTLAERERRVHAS